MVRVWLWLVLLLWSGCERSPAPRPADVGTGVAQVAESARSQTTGARAALRPSTPPSADRSLAPFQLSANPASGEVPLTVRFRVNGAAPGASLLWSFGDGCVEESTASELFHRYERPGTFMVQVHDQGGAGVVASVAVEAHERALEIDIEAVPDIGRAPLAVQFRLVRNDPSEPLRAVRWDFGDGHQSSGEATSHLFTEPGTFLVVVEVERENGAQLRRDVYVQVDPRADAGEDTDDFAGEDADT